MAKILTMMAHPGLRHSRANRAMWQQAERLEGITTVDLYARYPRFNIDTDAEQEQLVAHDVIMLQYPLFWYQPPALIKEWLDLVLEYGFAYGTGGDKLAGKTLALAVSAAGAEEAYGAGGYQNFPLRDFLRPMQQTATLCGMRFLTPYVLYGALKANEAEIDAHAQGYAQLLAALRDERIDLDNNEGMEVMTHATLPLQGEG